MAYTSFESAKSSYESACSSYGYSRKDSTACGPYGYVRSEYKSHESNLEKSILELQSQLSSANQTCGAGPTRQERTLIRTLANESKELKAANEKLTAENEKLRAEIVRLKVGTGR